MVVDAKVRGYYPGPDFEENDRDPLFELKQSNSTELWLIQWPLNELPDFHGKELLLNLNDDDDDRCLGHFEGSFGKKIEVMSHAVQAPNAMVFQPSRARTEMIGKVSRRVSIVNYPEVEELEQMKAKKKLKGQHHISMASSMTLPSSFASKSSLHGYGRTDSIIKQGTNSEGSPWNSRESIHASELDGRRRRSIAKKKHESDSQTNIT